MIKEKIYYRIACRDKNCGYRFGYVRDGNPLAMVSRGTVCPRCSTTYLVPLGMVQRVPKSVKILDP